MGSPPRVSPFPPLPGPMAPLRNGTPAPGRNGQWAPSPARVRISPLSPLVYITYIMRRGFGHPNIGHWHPAHPAAPQRAPQHLRAGAPLQRSTAAPQHRCTAPRITRHRHQHPRAPRAARPAHTAPLWGYRSPGGTGGAAWCAGDSPMRIVKSGISRTRGHIQAPYTSPIRVPYAPNMRLYASYKPNTRPLCAQYAPICAQYASLMRPICAYMRLYASVCPYPCGGRFISPEKPKK